MQIWLQLVDISLDTFNKKIAFEFGGWDLFFFFFFVQLDLVFTVI